MGQCHKIWREKKQLLKERGISWLSPSELNPYNRYDQRTLASNKALNPTPDPPVS